MMIACLQVLEPPIQVCLKIFIMKYHNLHYKEKKIPAFFFIKHSKDNCSEIIKDISFLLALASGIRTRSVDSMEDDSTQKEGDTPTYTRTQSMASNKGM